MNYAIFLLLLAQITVSSSGIFTRMALEGTGPVNATLFRVIIASAVTFAFGAGMKRLVRMEPP